MPLHRARTLIKMIKNQLMRYTIQLESHCAEHLVKLDRMPIPIAILRQKGYKPRAIEMDSRTLV